MYALTEINISENNETEFKKCADFVTYSAAKDPTGDPLAYADSAPQSYHTMKQLFGESSNKYRVRKGDKVRILLWLGLDEPSQQQAVILLFSLNSTKHADMTAELKNDALKIQILLTLFILYLCVTLQHIGIANLALPKIMTQFLVGFLIQLVKAIIERLEIKVRRRM